MVHFRLLGPVEMWVHGRRVDAGPPKSQLILAALLLEHGGALTLERLVRRVWGDDAPPKVAASVQSNLSGLRRRFAESDDEQVSLQHLPKVGYRLRVPRRQVDAFEFMALTEEARETAQAGDRGRALELLAAARRLIRGEPLTGLVGAWAESARGSLQEVVRGAALLRIRLHLELGEAESVVGELRELAEQHPLDESIAALLMRALDYSGRTADALAHYRAIHRRLREEQGISPHPPLVEEHRRILSGRGREEDEPQSPAEPAVQATATAVAASSPPAARALPSLNTLDLDPVGFTGRGEDLDSLTRKIEERLAEGRPAVCVISGMPGIGKSTFALRLAYHLLERGLCPDGALQVGLHGHDSYRPASRPEASLTALLGTLGLGPHSLQRAAGLDSLTALWKRYTDGLSLLLFLDDVSDVDQVWPLVPKGPGSVVLVTSRRLLLGLSDALGHRLTPMSEKDASALFAKSSGLGPNPSDEAIDRIVEICGRLPLALSITGGVRRAHPAWTSGDLADYLTRTNRVSVGNALSRELAASFELSYRQLPAPTRAVFRCLALYPGTCIDLRLAATLAGVGAEEAESALCVLVEHNLLVELDRQSYRMHDLLKDFAGRILETEAEPGEPDRARDRLLSYCVMTAERASALFHPYRHVPLTGGLERRNRACLETEFADAKEAAAWFDQLWPTLRAVAEDAIRRGRMEETALMARQLAAFLDRRGHWRESVPLHEAALETWIRSGERDGQARAHGDLAKAHWRLGQLGRALAEAEAARELWRDLGDERGQADAGIMLGRVHLDGRRPAVAARCFDEAVRVHGQSGDLNGQAEGLYYLASALSQMGRCDEAIAHCGRALDLALLVRDQVIERNCVNNLGEFLQARGDYAAALKYRVQAFDLAEHVGDPVSVAIAAHNLADMRIISGDPDAAVPLLASALRIFRRLGKASEVLSTLLLSAKANALLGRAQEARAYCRRALDEGAATGDPVLAVRLRSIKSLFGRERAPEADELLRLLNDNAAVEAVSLDGRAHPGEVSRA